MPAAEPVPTIDQFTLAYQGGLVSVLLHGDTHEGALHDHWAAVGAIMWRKVSEREQTEFRSNYFKYAKGPRLDAYIQDHFRKSRTQNAPGSGTALLRRATAGAGDGTVWEGTRIAVGVSAAKPMAYYAVTGNKAVGATETYVTVAVEAVDGAPAVSLRQGDRPILRLEDPLWDNSWTVETLECGDGTVYEDDAAFQARVATEVFEERYGFESLIVKLMKEAGADFVLLFPSDYLGEDNDAGLNRVYVADANLITTPELLRECRRALPDCAMAGASTQVLSITKTYLTFQVRIRFWAAPEGFDMSSAADNARSAIVEYFERDDNAFVWSLAGVRGAVQAAVPNTHTVEVTASAAAPTLAALFQTHPLPRYLTTPNRVSVVLDGPST